jgi:hypothetical protein
MDVAVKAVSFALLLGADWVFGTGWGIGSRFSSDLSRWLVERGRVGEESSAYQGPKTQLGSNSG